MDSNQLTEPTQKRAKFLKPAQIFAVILGRDCEVPENDKTEEDYELGPEQSLLQQPYRVAIQSVHM
jgi:hypothetical protein